MTVGIIKDVEFISCPYCDYTHKKFLTWSHLKKHGKTLEDVKNELIIDNCSGYYGDTDYMIKEAKSNIDHYLRQKQLEKQNKLKALIQNKVSLLKRENLLAI